MQYTNTATNFALMPGYVVTIQMVLFIMLYKVVLTFESVDEILWCDHSNESVVLFIMLYKVILTFESVDEILKCDHSNESYWAVLSCGTVYYAVQGGSNFWVCGWNPMVWPFTWWPVLFIMLFFTSHRSNYLNAWNKLLLVFSVTPFKMDQNKNKTFQ